MLPDPDPDPDPDLRDDAGRAAPGRGAAGPDALEEERAVDTSHQLTVLREQLLSPQGGRRG